LRKRSYGELSKKENQ